MRTYFNRIALIVALFLTLPAMALAAEPASTGGNAYNPMLIGLVSLILILLFVIAVTVSVLSQLTTAYREKMREERTRNNGGGTVATIIFLLVFCLPSLHAIAADSETVAAPVSKLISGIPKDEFYALMSMIVFEIIVVVALMYNIRTLVRLIRNIEEEVPTPSRFSLLRGAFWDRFHSAVAIEKEKDILLDHNYDGIQELDNSLPPWWKYGFYLTIVVAIIYLFHFHVLHTGASSKEEYEIAMQEAEEAKADYLAHSANNVDENSITLTTDAAEIAAGKTLFTTNCAACHAADGGGTVGPNLTDEYWLHGGGIKDIFKSIKYGWQDKGMKSWKDDFSPKQIAQLANFVKTLKGTHPAVPKDKQGELYIESGATIDSTTKTVVNK